MFGTFTLPAKKDFLLNSSFSLPVNNTKARFTPGKTAFNNFSVKITNSLVWDNMFFKKAKFRVLLHHSLALLSPREKPLSGFQNDRAECRQG